MAAGFCALIVTSSEFSSCFFDLADVTPGNRLDLLLHGSIRNQEQRFSGLLPRDVKHLRFTHPFVGADHADVAWLQTEHRREEEQPDDSSQNHGYDKTDEHAQDYGSRARPDGVP